jgi:uncharacterized membrane protein YidH (DUF202 family)
VTRDPGLAAERTQLAWQRYSFSVAIVAMLGLRAGLRGNHPVVAFGIAGVLGGLAAAMQYEGPRLDAQVAVRLVLAASLTAAAGALLLAFL